MKNTFVKTVFILAATVIFCALYAKGFSDSVKICDAFFISGAIILSAGILTLAANEGTFTALSFAVHKIFVRTGDYKTFSEDRKSKAKTQVMHLFVSGIFCILISLAFLVRAECL